MNYPEQKEGYKNLAYHCFICQRVYYPKIKEWLGVETLRDSQQPATSGVFHRECINKYIDEFLGDAVRDEYKRIMREQVEERISELEKKVMKK